MAAAPAWTQTPQAKADALLNESKWEDAAVAYHQLLQAEPANPAAWSGLG